MQSLCNKVVLQEGKQHTTPLNMVSASLHKQCPYQSYTSLLHHVPYHLLWISTNTITYLIHNHHRKKKYVNTNLSSPQFPVLFCCIICFLRKILFIVCTVSVNKLSKIVSVSCILTANSSSS